MPTPTEIAQFFAPITQQVGNASYVSLNINSSNLTQGEVVQTVFYSGRQSTPAMNIQIFGLKEFVIANAPSGSSYVLPIASASVLGGIKVGSGLTIDGSGVLSATAGGGTVTAVTASLPLSSSGGITPNISISQAGVATDGYLSSADWNTFNNKQNALSGTGFVKISGTIISYDNTTYYPYPTGTTGQYVTGNGSLATFPTIPTVTPSALTKVDDTNVTLTLGGSPSTALLQATSLTLGWTGTLADARITSASNWNTAYTNRITSATAPLSITSNVISISQATTSTDGYLSSVDWNTFNNKLSSAVTTFSAGTTGFTPNTATSGAVTLAGILNVANGGTGVSTATTINGTVITYGTTNTISAVASLSSLTAATAVNTLNNGNNTQTWRWGLSGGNSAMVLTETAAGTGAGYLLSINGLSGSAINPFRVQAQGATIFTIAANGNFSQTGAGVSTTFTNTGAGVFQINMTTASFVTSNSAGAAVDRFLIQDGGDTTTFNSLLRLKSSRGSGITNTILDIGNTTASATNKGINVQLSGTNDKYGLYMDIKSSASVSASSYGMYSSISNSLGSGGGTVYAVYSTAIGQATTMVYGGFFSATGSTSNNYALVTTAGSVGVNTATPLSPFTVNSNSYFGGNVLATSTVHIGGSLALPYVAKTALYTLTANDHTVDCTSGTFTITLPTAVGITGRIYVIKNSGTGTITLATTSSQTIDGSTTKVLNVQYQFFMVQSDNANWKIISQ